MAGKDVVEKTLESYNDVFADIVNVLIFDGRRIVKEDTLENETARSIYKADGKMYEQERDVAKYWKHGDTRISVFGLENQTKSDPDMPLRLMCYDGAAYRSQMQLKKENKQRYPVLTLVLHFDYEKQWEQPQNLKQCFHVPALLEPFVNDYKMNLFEIAWLSREQVKKFKSDFYYVADYFVQMRIEGAYSPPKENIPKIQHAWDLCNTMTVLTGDNRFINTAEEVIKEGGVFTMCEAFDRAEERGRKEERMKNAIKLIHMMESHSDEEVKEMLLQFDCTLEEADTLMKEHRTK